MPKLNAPDDIHRIFEMYYEENKTAVAIAEILGISNVSVNYVLRRKNYAWVELKKDYPSYQARDHRAKLSDDVVINARREYLSTKKLISELHQEYAPELSYNCFRSMIHGDTYKWVKDDDANE